jgi:alkanesulfonate monooxygenase SsuD/methylene tetrahydromethanopterin reductase-like flavin-dependent oxidoreductase (luciferase family)
LGVGVGGEYPQEFRAVQVPPEERGGRTNEIIPLLRRFWTATDVTHQGRYYEMQDVRIHPPPTQPGGPPIVVAGRKEPSMRRAALMGDGWFPYMYSPRRYAESVQKINSAAAQAGRNLAGFHWCLWVFLNIGPDGDVAREEAARTMGGTYMQDVRGMVDLPVTADGTQGPVLDRLFAEVLPVLREHAGRMP